MSINFDMSNSWSPKLRQGLGSTVHICPRSNGRDYIRVSHIAISRVLWLLFFEFFNSRSSKPRQGVGSTVHITPWDGRSSCFRDLVSPFSPCTLNTVQVFLNPMVVGPYAPIWRLRSILLFNTLFLSFFRSYSPHAVGNFGWDPTIRNASQRVSWLVQLATKAWKILACTTSNMYQKKSS